MALFRKFNPVDGLSTDNEVTFSANLTIDTNVLFVDTVNNRVGINKTPTTDFDVNGDLLVSGTITANSIANIGNGILTIEGGAGLTGSGTFNANEENNVTITVEHDDTSTQSSVNNSGATVIQDVTLDNFGHVTDLVSKTISYNDLADLPVTGDINDTDITLTAGSGLTGGGIFSTNQGNIETITINHADTSSQSSVNNSGATVIQDVSLDGFGHVTNLTSKTITYGDLSGTPVIGSGNITMSAGSGLSGGGAFGVNQTFSETITFSHADTSAQSSVNGSGLEVIQDVTLDTYGHVTGLGTKTITTADINSLNVDAGTLEGLSSDAFLQSKADVDALNVDAGTLDGINSTGFLRSDTADIKTNGNLRFNDDVQLTFGNSNDTEIYYDSFNGYTYINGWIRFGNPNSSYYGIEINPTNGILTAANFVGDGSQLTNVDAETLDGINSTSFLQSDASDVKTVGNLRFNDNVRIEMGTSGISDSSLYFDGTDVRLSYANAVKFNTSDFTFAASGDFTAAGDITAFSDIRLKENIEIIPNAVEKISQISGVTYTRNDKETDRRFTGVIAQEVEEVLPEAVSTEINHDGEETKTVAYGNMVGLLIEAIKEQQKRIEELEKRLS